MKRLRATDKWLLAMFAVLVLANSSLAGEKGDNRLEKRIDIYQPNPAYWQYGGKGVLLLGGSVEDNLFQIPKLTEHLDLLKSVGGNYVRNTMSSRDKDNVWAFAKTANGKYDLNQWNDEYWQRFEKILKLTSERDMIVQIEIWATFDYYRDIWILNPFNPKNNINYTAEQSGLPIDVPSHPILCGNNFFWSVPAENNQQTVLKYQQKFVDKILSYSLKFGNVLYCMDNETAVTAKWGKYWSQYIKAKAKQAGIKVHTTEMWDPWNLDHRKHKATFEHPEVYSFVDISQNNHQKGQKHWDNAQYQRRRLAGKIRPLTNIKIYGADGGKFGNDRDGMERFWRNIFGQMASARFHRSSAGLGLSKKAQANIKSMRMLTDQMDVFTCSPHNDLLSQREDNEAYCLANPGKEYAVYFTNGGDIVLDVSDTKGAVTIEWLNIANSNWRARRTVTNRKQLKLTAPSRDYWAVLVNQRQNTDICTETVPYRNLEEVIVCFKTHFDLGFTDLAKNVVHRYRTELIDKALKVAEQSNILPEEQRFVWTVPGWPMTKILEDWPGQTHERQQAVMNAFKNDRFVTHALAYTTHTESLELEDMARSLIYSSQLCRQSGKELVRAAKMTDVPSHSWILPTLLKNANIDFLHLGCNASSRPPKVPLLFWWQGPDGSKLLTMYVGDYGTGIVPPADWPYKTWLAMIMTGDNIGPPTKEQIEEVLQTARKRLPSKVKIKFGQLSDFSDAILKENPNLPVIRGDMPDNWIHNQLNMPIESAIVRRMRPKIAAVESLHTLLECSNVKVEPIADDIAAAYDHSLRFGEHTWGYNTMYIKPKRSYGKQWQDDLQNGRYDKHIESWKEKGSFVYKLRDLIQKHQGNLIAKLAKAVKTDGKRIVVYNPLPWKRDAVVEVKIDCPAPTSLKNTATGHLLRVNVNDDTIRFTAKDLPAAGYTTYLFSNETIKVLERIHLDKINYKMENTFFKVEFDRAGGCIKSIIDKRSGRELVDDGGKFGFGQYFYQRFGKKDTEKFMIDYLRIFHPFTYNDFGKRDLPDIPYIEQLSSNAIIKYKDSGTSVSTIMEFPPTDTVKHRYSITVTLYDLPYLDITWSTDDKNAVPEPEGGWMTLPLKVNNPQYRLGRLAGIVNPYTDLIENTYKDIFALNGGAAVFDNDGAGIGICPLDSLLVSIGAPGLWKTSRTFKPQKPTLFVNLHNNMWGTNSQQWNGGSWSSSVRLWCFDKYHNEPSLITPSYEARNPVIAGFADGQAGTLPVTTSGVKISRKGILMTAFGANPDGDGLILRLWEQAGKNGKCKVTLPDGLKINSIYKCDLRGTSKGEPLTVRHGAFTFESKAYAPASFILK